MLEDLAADPDFTGHLLVGVAPDIFFSGFAYHGNVLPYYQKQGPSQRSGNWLSMHLLEPYFAFYEPDFALATVVKRQAWPARPGVPKRTAVRKLRVSDADRNTQLWRKVETDANYRALARSIWAEDFGGPLPGMDTPANKKKVIDEQIAKAAAAIIKLRARGVRVLFVRPPRATNCPSGRTFRRPKPIGSRQRWHPWWSGNSAKWEGRSCPRQRNRNPSREGNIAPAASRGA